MAHPLAEARRRAKLSQEALAEMAKVSRVTVSRIEKRRHSPSMEMAARIIGALRQHDVDLSADVFLPETVQ